MALNQLLIAQTEQQMRDTQNSNNSFLQANNDTKLLVHIRDFKSVVFGGFIAHRGGTFFAPENSLKAISIAGRRKFARVEIDPQKTSDANWILMHDASVDRTTDGTGNVSALSLAQIQALKIDIPTTQISADEIIRVPLFEDALKEAASYNMGANIDGDKFTWVEADYLYLIDLLIKYNLLDKAWIYFTTQSQRILSNQYAPELAIAWTTVPASIAADLAEAVNYQFPVLIYHTTELTQDIIGQCNAANVSVMAYRCDTIIEAYKWYRLGVRYIETDYILPGGEF